VKVDAYGDAKFHGTVYQMPTPAQHGAGTQEEVTNFQVKIESTITTCC